MSTHSFKVNFFINPLLCDYCSDYIWGSGYIGYTCDRCFKSVHSQCKYFLLSNQCNDYITSSTSLIRKRFSKENYKIEKVWTVNEVKEWLAVVNLHRYSEVLAKMETNGERLFKIDKTALKLWKIKKKLKVVANKYCPFCNLSIM